MSCRLVLSALVVGSLVAATTLAIPVPSPNLDKLTETSNLIVLGELVLVEPGVGTTTVELDGDRTKARLDRGTLRVDQVLKGGRQPALLKYDFPTPDQPMGWQIPTQATHGIFFFRLSADKSIAIADLYHGYIPTSRSVLASGDTPLDRITNILGKVLTTPNTDHDLGIMALRYLQSSGSKSANVALRASLNNSDPELRLTAASALIRKGDGTGLEVIKREFISGPGFGTEGFREGIGNSIAYYVSDPKYVPDLEQLLQSSSVYMRRGASGALRLIGSQAAVKGLLKALEDSDFEVRYFAVLGLAEVTKQDNWKPNEQAFRAREFEYVSHWREWARNR